MRKYSRGFISFTFLDKNRCNLEIMDPRGVFLLLSDVACAVNGVKEWSPDIIRHI